MSLSVTKPEDSFDEQLLLELDEALQEQNVDSDDREISSGNVDGISETSTVASFDLLSPLTLSPVSYPGGMMSDVSSHEHHEHDAPQMYGALNWLSLLPKEVLFRVFSFLSATDLVSCQEVSRQFSTLAVEDTLWRRLYCARWGQPNEPSAASLPWKVKYMDKDGEDMHQAAGSAPDGMRDLYVQMQVARRDQALGRKVVDDMMVVSSPEARQVNSWLRSHGFADQAAGHRPASVTSPDQRFTLISGNTYACEATGWLHVCDETCRERIVDRATGLLVCPISGHVSERMMTDCEADAWSGNDRKRRRQEGQDEECWGERGRLAQAYLAGYNCRSEKELRRLYGVRLR